MEKKLVVRGIKGNDLITTGSGEVNDNSMIAVNFDSAFDFAYELAKFGQLQNIQVIINGKIYFTVEETTE